MRFTLISLLFLSSTLAAPIRTSANVEVLRTSTKQGSSIISQGFVKPAESRTLVDREEHDSISDDYAYPQSHQLGSRGLAAKIKVDAQYQAPGVIKDSYKKYTKVTKQQADAKQHVKLGQHVNQKLQESKLQNQQQAAAQRTQQENARMRVDTLKKQAEESRRLLQQEKQQLTNRPAQGQQQRPPQTLTEQFRQNPPNFRQNTPNTGA